MSRLISNLRRAALVSLTAGPLALAPWALFAQQPPGEGPPPAGQQQQQPPGAPGGQEQQPPGQPPAGQQQPPQDFGAPQAGDIDDEMLDQFVDAFRSVQEIQVSATEELQQVEDEQRAREIQQQAQEEMVEAVRATGLSVEDYNRIAQLMNTDPEVREGVLERLDGQF